MDSQDMPFSNIPEGEFSQEWYCLWNSIIHRLQEVDEIKGLPVLIRLLSKGNGIHTWKSIKHITEYALQNAKNVPKIFSRVSSRIKRNGDKNDEIVNAMFAELQAIPAIKTFGGTDINYQREGGLDFLVTCKNGMQRYWEVKYIEETFKTQGIFKLLQNVYNKKEKQILKYDAASKSIIFIITHFSGFDPFWLDHVNSIHPIQLFIDKKEIPMIILGPHSTVFVSQKLDGILLPFDRYRFIQEAYGTDVRDMHARSKNQEEKMRKIFSQAAGIKE